MKREKCLLDSLSQQQDLCSPTALESIRAYLQAPRKQKSLMPWYAACMNTPHASVFFRGSRDSSMHRITVCDLVAKAYEEVLEQDEIEVIAPSYILKLRERAAAMSEILPGPQHLPVPANTQEFRVGLELLKTWKPPVTTPMNHSGNPTVRALTLLLARRFADAFIHIPVEYIHHLVTIGWPSRSRSASRRLLTASVTHGLKTESEKVVKLEKEAHSTAMHAIQAAAKVCMRSGRHDAEERSLELLEGEVSRLKRGLRRFTTDVARLRAMQDIAVSFDDPNLVEELNFVLTSVAREFKA